jgi:hypothetical protein
VPGLTLNKSAVYEVKSFSTPKSICKANKKKQKKKFVWLQIEGLSFIPKIVPFIFEIATKKNIFENSNPRNRRRDLGT